MMKKTVSILISMMLIFLLTLAAAETVQPQTETLPLYGYTGDDPVLGSVLDYTVELSKDGYQEEVNVTIPSPIIVRVVKTDEDHVVVYGDFWGFNYTLEGSTLVSVSGGENPGVMELERKDGKWVISAFTVSDDGEEFYSSIEAMCGGDEELKEQMFAATDGSSGVLAESRMKYIREYVEANKLPIDSYQDPYWEPIPLNQDEDKNE